MADDSLTRALDILRCVASASPRRFKELRELFQINNTTLSKILNTLTAKGFLDKQGRGYVLGQGFKALAMGRSTEYALREAVCPLLPVISQCWCVTAILVVHYGNSAVFLDKAVHESSPAELQSDMRPKMESGT